MKVGITTFLAILALALWAYTAWWPGLPTFSSLTRERATVQKTERINHVTSRTTFKTQSGLTIARDCGRGSVCRTKDMQRLEASHEELLVWHDGKNAYQISLPTTILLRYEDNYQGREMYFLFAVIASVATAIRIGRHSGLINPPISSDNPNLTGHL